MTSVATKDGKYGSKFGLTVYALYIQQDTEGVGIRRYLILSRGRIMEQLWFSTGLVTPLIQYCRVIIYRLSRTLLLSVFNLTFHWSSI